MAKFLKRLFLFAFFVFITDKCFYFFLAKKTSMEADRRLEYVLDGKINKEILIFGSSRGADNIIASQIEAETGYSSYNLSYPGSNIEFHHFILQTVLQFNKKPNTIILAIDSPSELIDDATLTFRLDRLYPLSKYNYINAKLVEKKERSVLSYFLCLARLSRESLSLKKKEDSKKNPIMACGSMPFTLLKSSSKFLFDTHPKKYNRENELSSKRYFFKQFEKICHDNDITLIYCFPPNFRTYDPKLENRIRSFSNVESKVFVYDSLNDAYKDDANFYDESHLNIKGAKIFTKELSNYIHLENQKSKK